MDRIEHYAVCPVVWRFLGADLPVGLGLGGRLRDLASFFAISDGMTDDEKVTMAIAVYTVSRTVHACRLAPESDPMVLLRLHAKFGKRHNG